LLGVVCRFQEKVAPLLSLLSAVRGWYFQQFTTTEHNACCVHPARLHAGARQALASDHSCWPLIQLACSHPEKWTAARNKLHASSKVKGHLWEQLTWILKMAAAIQEGPVGFVRHALNAHPRDADPEFSDCKGGLPVESTFGI
jgi:hypothetical protein